MSKPIDLVNITLGELLRGARKQHESEVRQGLDDQFNGSYRLDIPLDTAVDRGNPMMVDFPFDGLWVVNTIGSDAFVNMGYGVNRNYNDLNPTPLRRNLAMKFDSLNLKARLWWPAQTGKFLSVIFYQGNDVRPGSEDVNVSGTVRFQNPDLSAIDHLGSTANATSVSCPTAGPPAQLCIANTERASFLFQADQNVIYTTSASVIVPPAGITVPAGQVFKWENEGPLWAQGATADAIVTGIEETFTP